MLNCGGNYDAFRTGGRSFRRKMPNETDSAALIEQRVADHDVEFEGRVHCEILLAMTNYVGMLTQGETFVSCSF